ADALTVERARGNQRGQRDHEEQSRSLSARWTTHARWPEAWRLEMRRGGLAAPRQAQDRPGVAGAGDRDQALTPLASGLDRARGHWPRAVVALRLDQEGVAARDHRLVGFDSSAGQCIKRLPGRPGIAGHVLRLAPAAVVVLAFFDPPDQRSPF